MKSLRIILFVVAMLCCQIVWAAPKGTILYVPLDNRPVCLSYAVATMEKAGWEVKTPPLEYIAGVEKGGDPEALFAWLLYILRHFIREFSIFGDTAMNLTVMTAGT